MLFQKKQIRFFSIADQYPIPMTRLLCGLLLMAVFVGCEAYSNEARKIPNVDSSVNFREFPVVSQIHFEKFIQHSHDFARSVLLTDTSIFVTNDEKLPGDYFFYEYSLSTKNLVGKYVKGGRRKGMTIGPITFGLHEKKELFIRDISKKTVLVASLADKYSLDSIAIQEYASPQFGYAVQLMKNNRLLKTGIENTQELLQLTDYISDSAIKTFGMLPPAPDKIPMGSWKHANVGYLFVKPDDESKAAYAFKYSDKLQIIDLNTGKSVAIQGPDNIDVDFIPIKSGDRFLSTTTEKTVNTFRGGTVTSKYIYLLYSGLKVDTENYIFGKSIFVFDWNGKPVKKFEFPNYISGLAVTDDDATAYAFDPVTHAIIRASLK